MLAAHAAIARYLTARIDLDAGLIAPHVRMKAGKLIQNARRKVNETVEILRGRGAGPEYVLTRMKELLATLPRTDSTSFDRVRQEVIRWVIEEYYNGMEARDVRPETRNDA